MKISRWQMLGIVVIAATIGYFAASTNSKPEGNAQASTDERKSDAGSQRSRAGSGSEADNSSEPDQVAQAKTAAAASAIVASTTAQADKKPNILFIMGDDVGWFNVGAYHQGIMSGKTPNLDRLAREGMRFTDYYAEASCTAGRANFITDEPTSSRARFRYARA